MLQSTQKVRCFKGTQNVFLHKSSVLNCDMTFGAYIPDHDTDETLPVLFYLSGLTCNHANFMEKSGMQRIASRERIIVIHPDTSPRGVDLPGDSDNWDFGKGAGFYVDALAEPWTKHYNMYSYVSDELVKLCTSHLPIDENRIGIFGHSMGGHGAMVIGLRNPHTFKSISAFAPIAHPIECDWGVKAFTGYLGNDKSTWASYDSSELIKAYNGECRTILVDQGEEDSFLKNGQLRPESLESTDKVQVKLRLQPGFDHSYFFISTFIEDHFLHHASIIGSK